MAKAVAWSGTSVYGFAPIHANLLDDGCGQPCGRPIGLNGINSD